MLPGESLSLIWVLPFAGLLLSIALLPLLLPKLWHSYDGPVAAAWGLAILLPITLVFGIETAAAVAWHVVLEEYLPFITLLLALYTTAGGVLLQGRIIGTPGVNTAMLAAGTLAASVMGTTGACMVLIRPFIRANAFRRDKTHSFVFFIFLVGNIGGALTPLGDPPLYLGFLKGVSFFWTTQHLAAEMIFCAVPLLGIYYLLDRRAWAREQPVVPPHPGQVRLTVQGQRNLGLLAAIVGVVLLQGIWRPGEVTLWGAHIGIERLIGMAAFLALTGVSLAITPHEIREANGFEWSAIKEVAKLFGAIFLTMAPVLAILKAGAGGVAAPLLALISTPTGEPIPWLYFWMTGLLSGFLDNAPTYLIFFNLAGGDPVMLMGQGALTLAAVSCGAVFMGALSYIGNAPNLMVKSIAERQHVKMPSFFGYCGWAALFLLPLYVALTLVFYAP